MTDRSLRICLSAGIVAGLLATVFAVWRATYELDPPVGIVTWSNSFLTDEGFHAKWAHQRLSFGQGVSPNDVTFLPVTHLHNLLVFGLFSVFGVSFGALRLYALIVASAGLFAFWALVRQSFGWGRALIGAVLLATAFNFAAYARVAFAEPLAILFCVLSALAYGADASPRRRAFLSVVAAFAALAAKLHFVTFAIALGGAWTIELWLRHRAGPRGEARGAYAALVLGVLAGALFYAAVVAPFWRETIAYHSVVSPSVLGRDSAFDLAAIVRNERVMFDGLLANTHSPVSVLLALGLSFFGARRIGRILAAGRDRASALEDFLCRRTDFLLAGWVLVGLAMIGSISYQPPRYFLFVLVPLSYFAVRAASACPPRLVATATMLILGLHLAAQAPYYREWLGRDRLDSQHAGFAEIAGHATEGVDDGEVRVIGASAAMLALFDPRIRGIHPDFFSPDETLCDRLAYWHPRYAAVTRHEMAKMVRSSRECGARVEWREIDRVALRDGRANELILSELSYPEPEPPLTASNH